MSTIYNWLFGTSKKKAEEQADETYQITEYDGEIWLTLNGALICPTDMFSAPPLEALSVIRKLYVKRHTTEEEA